MLVILDDGRPQFIVASRDYLLIGFVFVELAKAHEIVFGYPAALELGADLFARPESLIRYGYAVSFVIAVRPRSQYAFRNFGMNLVMND